MLVDKLAAKQLLQKSYGLSESSSAVIISLVGRLTEQKGIQLLSGVPTGGSCSVMEAILRRHPEVQFLVGGPPTAGDPAMESFGAVLKELEERYPGRVRAVLSFIPHRSALQMTLGSDLFLMPSRFEPGGITQLEALACGAVVVARRVGGLAATLIDAHQDRERGNSFLFSDFSPEALERALERALQVLSSPRRHQALLRQALLAENDWSDRVPKYVAVLQHVAGVFNGAQSYPYLVSKRHLLGTLKA